MSLLTFKRKDPEGRVSVIDTVWSINRQLERHYPDCTCCVLAAVDSGMPSEWVTIELEITHESLASLDWYTERAEAHGLVLTDLKPGQRTAFETDVISTLLSRRAAGRPTSLA